MKTEICLPDDVFRRADQAAEQLRWSRSQLYSTAVQEFLDRRDDDSVTGALNDLADEFGPERTPDSGHSLIESGAWT